MSSRIFSNALKIVKIGVQIPLNWAPQDLRFSIFLFAFYSALKYSSYYLVTFKSITENIDTTTASGELIFHIFCSLAQFERRLIKERINAGIAAAKARGKIVGRKKGISKEAEKKAFLASALYTKNEWSTTEICNHLNVSRATLYKYLKLQNTPIRAYQEKYEIIS